MDPFTIATIAGGAISIGSTIAGGISANKAAKNKDKVAKEQKDEIERLKKEAGPRPVLEMSDSDIDALELSKDLAGRDKLPGQELMENKIHRTGANAMGQIAELSPTASSAVANIQGVAQDELGAVNDLNIQAAIQKYKAEQDLVKQMRIHGEKEQNLFAYNQAKPYDEAMAAISALENASIHNEQAAIDDKASVEGDIFGMVGDIGMTAVGLGISKM